MVTQRVFQHTSILNTSRSVPSPQIFKDCLFFINRFYSSHVMSGRKQGTLLPSNGTQNQLQKLCEEKSLWTTHIVICCTC